MPAVSTITRSKPGGAQEGDRVREHRRAVARFAGGSPSSACRSARGAGVHADAVAEQRAAGAPAGRVDGRTRDRAGRGSAGTKRESSSSMTVALAGAAGAGDADHRDAGARAAHCLRAAARARASAMTLVLERREHPRDAEVAVGAPPVGRGRGQLLGARARSTRSSIIPTRPSAQPSSGRKIRSTPRASQVGDLVRRDRAAAAAEDADVAGAELAEHLDRVAEVLDVAALVGADRDPVGVLLDRRADDVADAAVVAEVDHLGPGAWISRRITLIAASWPSNSEAAVTKRSGSSSAPSPSAARAAVASPRLSPPV